MILFKTLRFKNFLSTGNTFTEIQFNKSPATLIYGTNGNGKSTFIDALCFSLFGKPYRNINIPTLVNSINDRDLVVELEFSIGRSNYIIRRGIKPKIFEIYRNKKLLDQDSKNKDYQSQLEQNILKLNYRSFTQVVILGSATFVPFMRLKAADRRFIIEDLLDIHIFSAMNVILKQKVGTLRETLSQLEIQNEINGEKLDIQNKYLENLKADNKNKIKENQEIIAEYQLKKKDICKQIETLHAEINEILFEKQKVDTLKKQTNQLERLQESITHNLEKTTDELKFYTGNETCPTCEQTIDDSFKREAISSKEKRIMELQEGLQKLDEQLGSTKESLDKAFEVLVTIQEKEKEISKFQSDVFSFDKYIKKIQDEIEKLQNKKEISPDDEKKNIELKKELKRIEKSKKNLFEEKQYLDIVAMMLKDTGIKTKIIKQYLPLINKLVNKYLSDLDFFVNFNFDESFREEIKSRGRDNFSYENFSEGEKLRIDLAILFAFREISRMKNQSNCNLLILDEILDRSMDAVGIDNFLKIMNKLWKNLNVFIISPRGELFMDKFPATIRFIKTKQFSGWQMTREGLEHLENIPSWDKYFLSFIPTIITRSKDKHTQVGCLIVNIHNNIIMTGYNSLPAGIDDYVPERYERPEKYNWMAHAEENGITACAKAGIATFGSRIYQPAIPCITCARLIIGAGIKEIIYSTEEHALWNSPKYDKTMEAKTRQMLYEAQIVVRGV